MGGAAATGSSMRPTVCVDGGTETPRRQIEETLDEFTPVADARHAAFVILVESANEPLGLQIQRIATCRAQNPAGIIVFVACSPQTSVAAATAFRARIDDYLHWPAERARLAWWRARLTREIVPETTLVGSSRAMQDVRTAVRQLAAVDCRVLLLGETGTGKEVAARALHAGSRRAGRPFVTINCPAIPDTLFESELFGFERGAFSGAVHTYHGRLVEADHGIVFLDEVGELPLPVQAKLLRAMEQREVQRLGARGSQRIDVRWIAATNRDLHAMVRAGAFRADLYYRLCVAEVVLPPLRARRDDIAALTRHFAESVAAEMDMPPGDIMPATIAALEAYEWPGNLRELRNAVETSLIRASGAPVHPSHLPPSVTSPLTARPIDNEERRRILDALDKVHWNKSQAAKKLQWSRMTLYRKLAYYRLAQHRTDEDTIAAG